MKTYKIDLSFENERECYLWEEKNIPDRKYNGEPILMVSHTEDYDGTITIDSITTIGA